MRSEDPTIRVILDRQPAPDSQICVPAPKSMIAPDVAANFFVPSSAIPPSGKANVSNTLSEATRTSARWDVSAATLATNSTTRILSLVMLASRLVNTMSWPKVSNLDV